MKGRKWHGLYYVGAGPDCTVDNVDMGQTGRKVQG